MTPIVDTWHRSGRGNARLRPKRRLGRGGGGGGGGGGGDHVPSSGMHLDVSRTLRGLGVRHRNEVRVRGGYTVDILIPSRAGAGSAEGGGGGGGLCGGGAGGRWPLPL